MNFTKVFTVHFARFWVKTTALYLDLRLITILPFYYILPFDDCQAVMNLLEKELKTLGMPNAQFDIEFGIIDEMYFT